MPPGRNDITDISNPCRREDKKSSDTSAWLEPKCWPYGRKCWTVQSNEYVPSRTAKGNLNCSMREAIAGLPQRHCPASTSRLPGELSRRVPFVGNDQNREGTNLCEDLHSLRLCSIRHWWQQSHKHWIKTSPSIYTHFLIWMCYVIFAWLDHTRRNWLTFLAYLTIHFKSQNMWQECCNTTSLNTSPYHMCHNNITSTCMGYSFSQCLGVKCHAIPPLFGL